MKITRILCPTDFSESARFALAHAVALARTHGASLRLVHVYPFMVVMTADAPYFPSGLPLDEGTRARLLADLDAAAETARASGIETDRLLLEGDPAQEVLRHARTVPADLIVMGTHGRRGFDRWILGSVASRVVEKAGCPVLTVPPPAEGTRPTTAPPCEHILCPLELGASESTLEAALSMARTSRASLTLLHVLEGLPQLASTVRMAHIDWADFQARLEQDARQSLRQAVARQGGEGIVVDEIVTSGKPYREILQVAEKKGIRLIVMGIHGRNPLERAFFGSTALHVVRQARCPVLTVRPPEERSKK